MPRAAPRAPKIDHDAEVMSCDRDSLKIIDHATSDGRLAVSVDEFAHLAGIGRTSAYAAVQRGDVRAVRIGKKWCVPVREIERLLGMTEAA